MLSVDERHRCAAEVGDGMDAASDEEKKGRNLAFFISYETFFSGG